MDSITFQMASLYVGDLHPNVTESMLLQKFGSVGQVHSIRLCNVMGPDTSQKYAFVNFHHRADAERALELLNYDRLLDQPMRVMWSIRDSAVRNNNDGNIFIKNLEKSIDTTALCNSFSIFGKILSCKVVYDERGSRGYGYVQFESADAAETAIREFNGMMFNGHKVTITHFKPRQERQAAKTATVKDDNRKQMHVSKVQKRHPKIQKKFKQAQNPTVSKKPKTTVTEAGPAVVSPAVHAAKGKHVPAPDKPVSAAVKPVASAVKAVAPEAKPAAAAVKPVAVTVKAVAAPIPTADKAVQAAAPATVKKAEPAATPTGRTATTPPPGTDEKLIKDTMGRDSTEQFQDTQTSVPAPARTPLTIYMLESADVEKQISMLYEYMLPLVEKIHPTRAKDITWLVIQRENNYNLLNMIAQPNLLCAQVEQIVAMLQVREAGQDVRFPAPKKKIQCRIKKKNIQ